MVYSLRSLHLSYLGHSVASQCDNENHRFSAIVSERNVTHVSDSEAVYVEYVARLNKRKLAGPLT